MATNPTKSDEQPLPFQKSGNSMTGAEKIATTMDVNKPNKALSESKDSAQEVQKRVHNGSAKSVGRESPPPRRASVSDSFQSNSSNHSPDAAVLILQKNARGMCDRSKTKDLAASKQAAETLISTLDPMLSPTENATKLLENLMSASNRFIHSACPSM
jgi:hypothetical protein